jgi:hypothetical protein
VLEERVHRDPMNKLFKALLNGIHQRGDGGVLYVKGEECGYLFPREFKDATFRGHLEELLQGERAHEVYFAVEERDSNMHVLAYPKSQVLQEAMKEDGPVIEEVVDAVTSTEPPPTDPR